MEQFNSDFKNKHDEFLNGELSDQAKDLNPIDLFVLWYNDAISNNCVEPNKMVLSTVGSSLIPSSRIVYLKEFLNNEFVFYTNYDSQKSTEIAQNNNVSLLFYWDQLQRQVCVRGLAEKIPGEISDAYFADRPRSSQIGAWASRQSQEVQSRLEIENAYNKFSKNFEGRNIPRPENWGGYKIKPNYIEFWQGRSSRLHDRICFYLENNHWKSIRKNP